MGVRKNIFYAAIITLTLSGCGDLNDTAPGAESGPSPSEIIIYQAREVITMDSDRPNATAIAVTGGVILAVGSLEEVIAVVGQSNYQINSEFGNNVIVPGLIEQHLHPFLAALTITMEIIAIEDWVLPNGVSPAANDQSDYIRRLTLAEGQMANADETLFTWGFHHYFHGKLTRANLDQISTTRPIVVWHRSAHELILNTSAMDRYRVTRQFYDELSEAEKAQSNYEEGHFWEQGLYPVFSKLMPVLTEPERLLSGLEFVKNYLHTAGVTTIAEPGGLVSKSLQNAQNAVLGSLNTPFRSYFIVNGNTMAKNQMENLIKATEAPLVWGNGRAKFLPKQVKLLADGAMFSQTMQMIDGYSDGHAGEWMIDVDLFKEAFNRYWDAGYQIHIHQNGDAGLEMILDLLEAAQNRHPRKDHRTTIVHFGFSTKEQVKRIAQLGGMVSANPYYLTVLADNYRTNGIGPERTEEMVRLGDVVRAGIPLALHSDMTMAPAQPLYLMWSAVNRTTTSGRVVGPNQRISVEEALKAVTINAAYSIGLEDTVGSLEAGKFANLTILKESPYEVDPDKIKNIDILATMLEGTIYPLH